jgi:hypothetical protein
MIHGMMHAEGLHYNDMMCQVIWVKHDAFIGNAKIDKDHAGLMEVIIQISSHKIYSFSNQNIESIVILAEERLSKP